MNEVDKTTIRVSMRLLGYFQFLMGFVVCYVNGHTELIGLGLMIWGSLNIQGITK